MKLLHRLRRLEEVIDVSGCPECRDRRGFIVWTRELRDADGTVIEERMLPAPCPRCGEIAEQIIEIVEVLVRNREEVKRLADLVGPVAGWCAARGPSRNSA